MEKTITAVCEVFRITRAELLNGEGKNKKGSPAYGYQMLAILLHIQGWSVNKIATKTHKARNMVKYSVSRFSSTLADKILNKYLQRCKKKLGINDDTIEQYRSRKDYKASNPMQTSVETKPTRWVFNENCKYAKTMHSFDIDDSAIERACQQAEKFFETYGKGQKQIAPIIEHPECYNG